MTRKNNTYRYPIVVLIGSIKKFKEYFFKYEQELTFKGYIVISLGSYYQKEDFIPNQEQEDILSQMLLQKIELADFVFVINPNGYIDKHTKRNIEWALELKKPIMYLYSLMT